jgi:hypothetical protein
MQQCFSAALQAAGVTLQHHQRAAGSATCEVNNNQSL